MTTSNINYASINENFPVAGQDNDTQVFRDNFDTIKNSLQAAKSEVTDLMNTTAKVTADNDFDNNKVSNVILQNVKGLKYDTGVWNAVSPATEVNINLDYDNGLYQIARIGANATVLVSGLSETEYTVLRLELYSTSSTSYTVNIDAGGGGSTVKTNSTYPAGGVTVSSSVNPVILEIWKHNANTVFVNYLGLFD